MAIRSIMPRLRDGRGLQLLTHPIWWTGDGPSARQKLAAYLAAKTKILDRAIADNCSIYQSQS